MLVLCLPYGQGQGQTGLGQAEGSDQGQGRRPGTGSAPTVPYHRSGLPGQVVRVGQGFRVSWSDYHHRLSTVPGTRLLVSAMLWRRVRLLLAVLCRWAGPAPSSGRPSEGSGWVRPGCQAASQPRVRVRVRLPLSVILSGLTVNRQGARVHQEQAEAGRRRRAATRLLPPGCRQARPGLSRCHHLLLLYCRICCCCPPGPEQALPRPRAGPDPDQTHQIGSVCRAVAACRRILSV